MTADLLPFPTPSAKKAMDRPIDYSRLAGLQGDMTVAQIKWWRGWAEAWQEFFKQAWARPW